CPSGRFCGSGIPCATLRNEQLFHRRAPLRWEGGGVHFPNSETESLDNCEIIARMQRKDAAQIRHNSDRMQPQGVLQKCKATLHRWGVYEKTQERLI
ncbi:MAG: hypothetical protein ACPGVA_02570, partial [Pikeienuella sp.]